MEGGHVSAIICDGGALDAAWRLDGKEEEAGLICFFFLFICVIFYTHEAISLLSRYVWE